MRQLLAPLALFACMAMSAPEAQGKAHIVTNSVEQTSHAGNILAVAVPSVLITNTVLEASGCCDQGYEVKSFAQPGCCDQGYEIKSMSTLTKTMIALVAFSLVALLWTYTDHFKRTAHPWTS